ncbi:MAG TPA: hypothetical protein VMM12_18090, partial [Longimicrobiales bacterium]|nr:hypothetical protein [Longimicrobiales bacterium]
MTTRFLFLAASLLSGACGTSDPTDPGSVAPPVTGPGNAFVWVGVFGEDRQFTDEEFLILVEDYDFVVIAAFHCGGRRACHNEAAQRLKELDPDITVLAYMNSFIREFPGTNELELYSQETWNDDWWLRHAETGEVIEVSGGRGGFKDLTDPTLRGWMIGVIQGWLGEAPFDGVAYDRLQGV